MVHYRIATSAQYPSGARHVGWRFGISQGHVQEDLCIVARVIEASGADWIGFQNANGGRLIPKQHYLRKWHTLAA